MLPVDPARQLLPGTFEHAQNHLLEHAVDLSHFDSRFRNDEAGALTNLPALLLKVVLAVCDQQGRIGREMFPSNGVKLPSNASKHRSGTRADFERQAQCRRRPRPC